MWDSIWLPPDNCIREFAHEEGFSPLWKTMCFFKIPLGMNYLSQDSQIRVLKMAFLQCGRLCASQRFQLTWTFFTGFTNSGPENDFSPVWKTMWFFKIALDMNFLSHDSQIRVLKLAFLQYGKLCASLRLHVTWTFCHIIHKSGSWKWLFSSMEHNVLL